MEPFDTQIKKEVDGYIECVYPEGIRPMQTIEVKLAFYAGMLTMSNICTELAEAMEGGMLGTAQSVENLIQTVRDRAEKLNDERAKQ